MLLSGTPPPCWARPKQVRGIWLGPRIQQRSLCSTDVCQPGVYRLYNDSRQCCAFFHCALLAVLIRRFHRRNNSARPALLNRYCGWTTTIYTSSCSCLVYPRRRLNPACLYLDCCSFRHIVNAECISACKDLELVSLEHCVTCMRI